MKIRRSAHDDKIALQMTPMIDIVFQLLVFFIMTFKIVLPEGDFNITMPSPASEATPQPTDSPTLTITMRAGPEGELAALTLGDQPLESFAELHATIRGMVDDTGGPGTASEQEVKLDCDFDLDYEYVIKAITAVSGYIDATGQRHKLIERIRFAPPEEEP